MADNYLEKKMEEHRAHSVSHSVSKGKSSLSALLEKCGSPSSFDNFVVRNDQLRRIVGLVAKVATHIPFRFKLLTGDDAAKLRIMMGCDTLPVANAYILICGAGVDDVLLGRVLQVVMLQAAEIGLSCACMRVSFDASVVEKGWLLPSSLLSIVAVGRCAELPLLSDIEYTTLSNNLIIE